MRTGAHLYKCGFKRAVRVDTMEEAAAAFAQRKAYENYGTAAYARNIVCETISDDKSLAVYTAVVGVVRKPHTRKNWREDACIETKVTMKIRRLEDAELVKKQKSENIKK